VQLGCWLTPACQAWQAAKFLHPTRMLSVKQENGLVNIPVGHWRAEFYTYAYTAPTFVIPKKDGSVRFISDFRELNKRMLRKPCPIPNIQDVLLNLEGFQWATSLDLNIGVSLQNCWQVPGHYQLLTDTTSTSTCQTFLTSPHNARGTGFSM